MLNSEVQPQIDHGWGPHTMERLVSHSNHSLSTLNSFFCYQGTKSFNAFSFDFHQDINPPLSLILKALSHMCTSHEKGALIYPKLVNRPWLLLIRLPQGIQALLYLGDCVFTDLVQIYSFWASCQGKTTCALVPHQKGLELRIQFQ